MRLQTPSTQSTDGQIVSEKYDPFFGMESGRCRRFARKDAYIVGAVTLSVCLALIGLFVLGFSASYDYGRLIPPHFSTLTSQSMPDATHHVPSKEAYVLFLPSVQREEYLLGCRVLIYGYKHDPETRDLTRDLVVMTTPQVPLYIEDQLRSEGAIVIRHDLITSIPNPHDVNGTHPWKDQFNKLLIWNMTQYERVLYHDSDMLLVKSISDIWDQDFASPESGLTATYQGDEWDDYLNGGWLLIRPNRTMFEELLLVRDWNSHWINDVEQVSNSDCIALGNLFTHTSGPDEQVLSPRWATPLEPPSGKVSPAAPSSDEHVS